jgi:hypothetical protein
MVAFNKTSQATPVSALLLVFSKVPGSVWIFRWDNAGND